MIAYVRVVDGELRREREVRFMSTGLQTEAEEAGVFAPEATPVPKLEAGEVGYLVTGVKDVRKAKVGDTVTMRQEAPPSRCPATGSRSRWCGAASSRRGRGLPELREALDKLRLYDAALVFEPESSQALGFGFRCGFLGLLHMDIVRERLEREYGLQLIATAPNVEYHVVRGDEAIVVHNPSQMPSRGRTTGSRSPWPRRSSRPPSTWARSSTCASPGAET